MDLNLSPDDLAIRARARSFAEEVLYPVEIEADERDDLPPERVQALRQACLDYRLNAINHDREHGGQGMTLLQQTLVNEEVGKATGALWGFVVQPPHCLRAGRPDQIEDFLVPACKLEISTCYSITEPEAGSDVAGVATSAVKTGNQYVINGEKIFASHAEDSDLVLLHAHVDGDPAKAAIFLVDPAWEGFEITRLPRFMQRGYGGHPEVTISDLKVPEERILGAIGQGFELTKDWFVEARIAIAARALGMAIRALELADAHAARRVQFGKAIREHQAVEFMLADMATRIMAGKSMLYRTVAEIDGGLERRRAHGKVSAIKLFCSEAGWRIVDQALQIFGGRGAMCENPVERLYRDIRLERIWEGTSEIQKTIIGGMIKKGRLDLYTGWDGVETG